MSPSYHPYRWRWMPSIFLALLSLTLASVYAVKYYYSDSQQFAISTTPALPYTGSSETYARPLVLYAYSESPSNRENLEFFVEKALHGRADFVFIFNGLTNDTELVPNRSNVEIVQRDNTCYDLGAYGEVLRRDGRWKKYKHFIVMNASTRGPFFPNYVKPCWTDMFLSRLNEHVKLVGTTINCSPQPHLQSQILAMDNVSMSILLDPVAATSLGQVNKWGGKDDPVGFTACYADRGKAVHSEIGITGLIRSKGYGIDVMMSSFSVDDKDLTSFCSSTWSEADPMVNNGYFGTNTHPYELVFMKTNRGVDKTTMGVLTKMHRERKWTSWDSCSLP